VADVLAPAGVPTRSAADVFMRRLLRVPADKPKSTRRDANRAFSTSILVSATRCTLTYIVLPFVAPILGIAKGVGPWIGIPIGVAAIVCNVLSMRRFFAADHKYRWAYAAIAVTVIGFLIWLFVSDLAEILS
jgi:hypothetical protein